MTTQTETDLQRLPPFLAQHFQADYREDVPSDVFESARTSALRVLGNPLKFPKADFAYLARLQTEMGAWV